MNSTSFWINFICYYTIFTGSLAYFLYREEWGAPSLDKAMAELSSIEYGLKRENKTDWKKSATYIRQNEHIERLTTNRPGFIYRVSQPFFLAAFVSIILAGIACLFESGVAHIIVR